jgi:hypothetical protein
MNSTTILAQLRTLQAVNPVAITIRRGPQKCSLTACPAKTFGEMTGGDGSLTKFVLKDWLIAAEDFTLTLPAEPQRGDVITVDASGKKYNVSHPDPTAPETEPHGDCEPLIGWRVHSVPD